MSDGKDHEDIESLEDVVKEAWEKVKNEKPNEYIQDIIENGLEHGEITVKPVSRESILYEHLFALVERAILSCNGNDVDEVCRLVETYDTLLAIGMAKDWEEDA